MQNKTRKYFANYKIMNKKERLEAIIGHYSNGKPSVFAKWIGVAPSTISSWLSRDTLDYDLIFAKCENLSPEWLLSGQGSMLKGVEFTPESSTKQKENDCINIDYGTSNVSCVMSDKPETIPFAEAARNGLHPIPLVTQQAAAGFGNGDFSIEEADVKEYYVIPKFKYCHVDFMIEVSGLSMYPHFNSGDVIACSILRNTQFIQWNKCHVIATREQGILVKRIMPGEDKKHLRAISDNKEYPPFDIPVDEITGIAVVVGSVGLE